MDLVELVRLSLFSPMVGAFVLGAVATLVRSDLRVPDEIYVLLSIYLLLAIGLKGGAELASTSFALFWAPALATLALGIAVPLWCYVILQRLGGFDVANAAAIAAHYGSVSAVTFSASLAFLDSLQIGYEGFMPTLVALLEVPAIVVALLVARLQLSQGGSWRAVAHEVLTGKSIVLLVGGLAIGFLCGPQGMAQVSPLFVDLFKGILTLFLLEMGLVTARRLRDVLKIGPFLVAFAIVMPVAHGLLGTALGTWVGLSLGGSMILGVLAASASYIAAPAAVRIALPEANPSYYLTAALAITFPFNLVVGLPAYYTFARLLHGSL